MSAAGARRRVVEIVLAAALVGLGALLGAPLTSAGGTPAHDSVAAVLAQIGGRCPWASPVAQSELSPSELASAVVARMTLSEKTKFVVLSPGGGYENRNTGVPALCIPRLTLQDGPDGIATGDTGVTALPASIGIAASFDPALAYAYGQVLGEEARGKGIDVVQAPNLNLARVPESGRIFEGYGEDPTLVSAMGDAEIGGIQSEGVMSDAKHFTAYNQETARVELHEDVSVRALEELYLAPFRSAVEDANIASIMCSYGELNGVNDCSDPFLYETLYREWGFTGFVRSDLMAVPKTVSSIGAAFAAGLDAVKPSSAATVRAAVSRGKVSLARLDNAVERVLVEMFRFHLVGRTSSGTPQRTVTTAKSAAFALRSAERSMVLLKDDDSLLPLHSGTSIAVIGTDADTGARAVGNGSAAVVTPFISRPLQAIEHRNGPHGRVAYARGNDRVYLLPPIPRVDYVAGAPLNGPSLVHHGVQAGTGDLSITKAKITPGELTAAAPGTGAGWRTWDATIEVRRSALYEVSLADSGDTWLTVDHRPVLSSPGLHARSSWATAIQLRAGKLYHLELRWLSSSASKDPSVGLEDVSPLISRAVQLARHAAVAVVFASDLSSEGFDRPNLSLPGDEDQLIEAVARANPDTVVVLNTGGAVLMPWLSKVAAVLEAWYPGEQDGAATAAVLFGKLDPSGRLPLTFPASGTDSPANAPATWPGVDGTVHYDEGLDIGYRYDEAHGLTPLFPFGFGLAYTTFSLRAATLQATPTSDVISVPVTNTGTTSGTETLECYLAYPAAAGEPPEQLRAFATVHLTPGQTKVATVSLVHSDFEIWSAGHFIVPDGTFTASLGTSAASLPLSVDVPVPQGPAGT